MPTAKSLLVISLLLSLLSCAGSSQQIGSNLTLCCPGNYDSYSSYSLQTEGMPGFLEDYLVVEFDGAFAEKNMTRVSSGGDLSVTLRYNHINLRSEQEEIDPFARIESLSTELSYIAAIEIEMRESSSGDLVWAGTVSRVHQVTPGEYMHQERARPAFRQAFLTLLDNYPARTPVE